METGPCKNIGYAIIGRGQLVLTNIFKTRLDWPVRLVESGIGCLSSSVQRIF